MRFEVTIERRTVRKPVAYSQRNNEEMVVIDQESGTFS